MGDLIYPGFCQECWKVVKKAIWSHCTVKEKRTMMCLYRGDWYKSFVSVVVLKSIGKNVVIPLHSIRKRIALSSFPWETDVHPLFLPVVFNGVNKMLWSHFACKENETLLYLPKENWCMSLFLPRVWKCISKMLWPHFTPRENGSLVYLSRGDWYISPVSAESVERCW